MKKSGDADAPSPRDEAMYESMRVAMGGEPAPPKPRSYTQRLHEHFKELRAERGTLHSPQPKRRHADRFTGRSPKSLHPSSSMRKRYRVVIEEQSGEEILVPKLRDFGRFPEGKTPEGKTTLDAIGEYQQFTTGHAARRKDEQGNDLGPDLAAVSRAGKRIRQDHNAPGVQFRAPEMTRDGAQELAEHLQALLSGQPSVKAVACRPNTGNTREMIYETGRGLESPAPLVARITVDATTPEGKRFHNRLRLLVGMAELIGSASPQGESLMQQLPQTDMEVIREEIETIQRELRTLRRSSKHADRIEELMYLAADAAVLLFANAFYEIATSGRPQAAEELEALLRNPPMHEGIGTKLNGNQLEIHHGDAMGFLGATFVPLGGSSLRWRPDPKRDIYHYDIFFSSQDVLDFFTTTCLNLDRPYVRSQVLRNVRLSPIRSKGAGDAETTRTALRDMAERTDYITIQGKQGREITYRRGEDGVIQLGAVDSERGR